MRRWVKALIGVVALAAVVSGIVVGTALAQGGGDGRGRGEELLNRVAQKLGITVEELKGAVSDSELEMLDEAVAQGRISACRADRVRQRIEEGHLFLFARPHGPHPGRILVLYAAAETLDMRPRALRAELMEGQSIAQAAEARGVSRDDLRAGILAEAEEHLDRAVENGRLAQERADEALQKLSENIDRIVDFAPCPAPASTST